MPSTPGQREEQPQRMSEPVGTLRGRKGLGSRHRGYDDMTSLSGYGSISDLHRPLARETQPRRSIATATSSPATAA